MKAAIYCRLSRADSGKPSAQEDSESIRNQKSMLIRYAMDQGWEIFGIYSDDNFSGADRNRPQFNRMIRDAEEGKFHIVLCKSLSRFTREAELVERYLHNRFPALGIRYVSLTDDTDTDQKGNRKARQVNALVNQWYLEELSDNIRATLTSRRAQGCHIGSAAPYGYQKDPRRKGYLIIDPEAAAVVREIYHLFLQGHGKHGIARILNERGIPNPTEYKRIQGRIPENTRKNSGMWTDYTIRRILTEEVYIGNMIQGRQGVISHRKVSCPRDQWIIVRNTHEPVISEEIWSQVQDLIARKAPTVSPDREVGIFAGKVRCLGCGYGMQSVKSGKKRGFRCSRHALSRKFCEGGSVSLGKLERLVLSQLSELSDELLEEDLLERSLDPFPEYRSMQAELAENIAAIQKQIDAAQAVQKERYLQKLRGQITDREYTDLLQGIRRETEDMETGMADLQGKTAEISAKLEETQDNKALIARYTNPRQLTREMVCWLIDYVEVGKLDADTKKTPVVIHWNF